MGSREDQADNDWSDKQAIEAERDADLMRDAAEAAEAADAYSADLIRDACLSGTLIIDDKPIGEVTSITLELTDAEKQARYNAKRRAFREEQGISNERHKSRAI
jgi:hypothetical protein